MKIWLLFFSVLATMALAQSSGTWTQVCADIDGQAAGDQSGYSVSMSADGTRVAIGAPFHDFDDIGVVRVYSESGGTWTQVGTDIDGGHGYELSGWSVSMSSNGRRVAIGAPAVLRNAAGTVGVYAENSGAWTQVGSDIDGEVVNYESGRSVSMSSDGTRVAIGAPGDSDNDNGSGIGYVRVYRLQGIPCDASTAPTNGGVGNCTNSLASGSTCQPTCNSGYTVSGTTSCSLGTLTAATCSSGSSSSPSSSPSSPTSAQDKKAAAEKTRDSILADITDARLKAKAKLLADAAIAGVKVQRLTAKLSAADEDAACLTAFAKAEMSASDGACVATAASSGKRRLSATTYDVEIMFSSAVVSDDALTKAADALKANGVEGVTSKTSVDPIAELKVIPGVDTSKLQTFDKEATEAAAAAPSVSTQPPPPPPPSPPPPSLVQDDDDAATGHRIVVAFIAVAAVLLLQ